MKRREFIRVLGCAGVGWPLVVNGPSANDLARGAAGYVDKILRDARPADLPIEQASKYELVINIRTAKALRLAIPSTLFTRADEVIE